MDGLKKKYALLSTQLRWAFWLIAVIGILFGVFAISVTPRVLTASTFVTGVGALIPAFLSIGSIISIIRLLYGRSSDGAGMMMILFFSISIVLVVFTTSGIGLLAAVIVLLVPSVISTLTIKGRGSTPVTVFSFAVGAAVMLIDTLYTGERVTVAQGDLLFVGILTVVTLASYLGFLAFQFHNFPLRTKLVFGFLLVAIIPVAIVGFTSSYLTQRALEEDANNALLASASQVSASLDSFVQYSLDTLRAEAQLSVFQDFLETPENQRKGSVAEKKVNAALAALRNRDPLYIQSYGLLDRKGLTVADTTATDVGVDKSGRDYYQETIRTGMPYMSPVEISPLLKTHVIYISAPVRDSAGTIIGVLRIRYDASIIHQQVSQNRKWSNERNAALVIDNHNLILANTSSVSSVYKSIIPLDQQTLAEMQKQNLLPVGVPDESLFYNVPDLSAGLQRMNSQINFTADIEAGGDNNYEQIGAVSLRYRPWKVVVAESQDVLMAPVLQQSRSIILVGVVVSILAVLFGLLVSQLISDPITRLTMVANRVAAGDLSAKAMIRTQDEVGILAGAFNGMTDQLSSLIGTLEQRVAERTRALSASADISRQLSTILDGNQLVNEVVTQLQEAFKYYHVHIYLFDEKRENLVMTGGSGEPGRIMLARGHRLAKGKGLVGRAAETGQPVLVSDVSTAENWLPNPLLPETKSEVAVPIAVGQNVLGVLDVQQDAIDGLKQTDVELLQSIANQVAVALQNAHTYAQAQRQASREALIAAIGQQIQHTTSTEEALQIAVREVGRAIGTEAVILLKNQTGNGNKHSI